MPLRRTHFWRDLMRMGREVRRLSGSEPIRGCLSRWRVTRIKGGNKYVQADPLIQPSDCVVRLLAGIGADQYRPGAPCHRCADAHSGARRRRRHAFASGGGHSADGRRSGFAREQAEGYLARRRGRYFGADLAGARGVADSVAGRISRRARRQFGACGRADSSAAFARRRRACPGASGGAGGHFRSRGGPERRRAARSGGRGANPGADACAGNRGPGFA
jgi:hypothetical protein